MAKRIPIAHRPQQRTADILKNAHFWKNIGHLEAAGKTKAIDLVGQQIRDGMAVELNVPGTYLIKTTDEIKERRFTGAVGTDDGMALTSGDFQIYAINDFAAAKSFMHIDKLKGAFAHHRGSILIS
jgi:hypothetical protein